jgi:hypothetical protein
MITHNNNIENIYAKTVTSEKIKKYLVFVKIGIQEYLKRADYDDRKRPDRIKPDDTSMTMTGIYYRYISCHIE